MRIVCPSCGAAYDVPEERLVPGRVVRCARCTNDWAPVPAPPDPAPEQPRLEVRQVPPEPPPAEPAVRAVPEPSPLVAPQVEQRLAPPSAPSSKRAGVVLLAAWVLSFATLGAAAWAAYDRREDVMRAWPASERAYAVLGISPRR